MALPMLTDRQDKKYDRTTMCIRYSCKRENFECFTFNPQNKINFANFVAQALGVVFINYATGIYTPTKI